MNSLADASIAGVHSELLIHHPEIVSDDVALLNVQPKGFQLSLIQAVEGIQVELGEALSSNVDILKIILRGLDGLYVWATPRDTMEIHRLQRGLEGREHVFMRVTEETICKFFMLFGLMLRQLDLRSYQRALSGEMQAQVRGAAVRAEQANCIDTVIATAVIAHEFPK